MQQDKMYLIRDREAGNIIGDNLTEAEAKALVIEFESIDTKEGTYTKDFYEIVEMEQDKNTTTESLLNGITKGEWKCFEDGEMGEHSIIAEPTPEDGGDIICEAPTTWETSMRRWKANARLIANAPRLAAENKELKEENERLKEQVEVMKHNNKTACILAMEFGYKQCEKGNNIEMAYLNYNEIINKSR